MILLKRRTPRSRSQQIRGELAEGIGHFKTATSHAANGAAERIAPRIDNALTVVGLRKRQRARWPWIAGAVVAGAAVGAAAMMMMRRGKKPVDDLFEDDPRAEGLGYPESNLSDRKEELAKSGK